MNMSQFSASLDHIDNLELARLASLWSAQALSGQVEARSIAYSYAAEQRRRSDHNFLSAPIAEVDRKFQQDKSYGTNKILNVVRQINIALQSASSRLN